MTDTVRAWTEGGEQVGRHLSRCAACEERKHPERYSGDYFRDTLPQECGFLYLLQF